MSKKLKVKLYLVKNRDQEILVRAKTVTGAVGFVAAREIVAELASQDDLVRLTKAGVEAVDVIDPEPDLVGARHVNAPVAQLGAAA